MKIIRVLSILVLLLIVKNELLAKENKNELRFSGKIINLDKIFLINKVHIYYNVHDGFYLPSNTHLTVMVDSSGKFEFSVPNLHKPYKLYLGVLSSDGKNVIVNENYFCEPKDNVKINIILNKGKTSISFSGLGAEKYNLLQKIEAQFWKDYYPKLNLIERALFKDSLDLKGYLENLAFLLKSAQENKMKLIRSAKINRKMAEILGFEYGRYNAEWVWRSELLFNSQRDYRKQITNTYFKFNRFFSNKPDSNSVLCPLFLIGELLPKTILELRMKNNMDDIDIVTFYNSIKNNYLGTLRDRLIGESLLGKISHLSPYTFLTIDSLLKDGVQIINNTFIKKIIIDKRDEIKLKKEKIYESEFIGLDGRKFDLKTLRGKVFLIDTWFNGCFACAEFHKGFENEVYSKFKENKNFSVLSINIDQNEEMWKKGLSSKKYSSEDYINVTTRNWLDHPFLKYYSVKGSPWVMLVDAEGKICYQQAFISFSGLITQIELALAKISK